MVTKRILILRIRKMQLKLLRRMMMKGYAENLTLTRHIEVKRGGRRERITYLISLCEWITERVRAGVLARGGETKSHTKVEVVKSHVRLCREEVRHKKKVGTCDRWHSIKYQYKMHCWYEWRKLCLP